MDDIGDDFIEKQFIKSNNELIEKIQSMCNPKDDAGYIYRELFIELYKNYQKQHEAIGCNEFDLFWQSLVVVNWFAAMVAKMKETNIQDSKRKAKKNYDRFKNIAPIEFDSTNESYIPRYPDLKERFPEFAESMQFLSDWYERASILSNENSEIRDLVNHEKLLIEQINEKIESSENKHLNICYFCKKLFESNRGGGHKSCGSDECKQRYFAGTKKRSRAKQSEIARRPKPPKAFNGKPDFCDEPDCTQRRVLYQFRDGNFCKPCCQTVLKIW